MTDSMQKGLGTQLRLLTALLDGELTELYREQEFEFRPRFYPVFRLLLARGQASVSDVASHLQASQPAATQTLAEMRKLDLVTYETGRDKRERLIVLTDKARAMADALAPTWDAIGRAAKQLDSELSYPLSEILDEALSALRRKSFPDRISECRSRGGE